jgi:hypothetical protein
VKDPFSRFRELAEKYPEGHTKCDGAEFVSHTEPKYRVHAVHWHGEEPVIYEVEKDDQWEALSTLPGFSHLEDEITSGIYEGWRRYQMLMKAFHIGKPFNELRAFRHLPSHLREEIFEELKAVVAIMDLALKAMAKLSSVNHDEKRIIGALELSGYDLLKATKPLMPAGRAKEPPALLDSAFPFEAPSEIARKAYPGNNEGAKRADLRSAIQSARDQRKKRRKVAKKSKN